MKKTLAVIGMLTAFTAVPAFAQNDDAPADMSIHTTKTTVVKPYQHDGGMMFQKMDTNHDGVISKEEHEEFGEKMFEKADTNHDGELSKEEVAAFHAKKQAMMKKHTGKRPIAKDSILNEHPAKDRQN